MEILSAMSGRRANYEENSNKAETEKKTLDTND
jgi:hypothetical protein